MEVRSVSWDSSGGAVFPASCLLSFSLLSYFPSQFFFNPVTACAWEIHQEGEGRGQKGNQGWEGRQLRVRAGSNQRCRVCSAPLSAVCSLLSRHDLASCRFAGLPSNGGPSASGYRQMGEYIASPLWFWAVLVSPVWLVTGTLFHLELRTRTREITLYLTMHFSICF